MEKEVLAYYNRGKEQQRLAGPCRLELERTKQIIGRHLHGGEVMVADVGGGPGAYATWLISQGACVDLVDPVPLHVDQAQAAMAATPDRGRALLADACNVPLPDDRYDMVLLLGPLYHLTAPEDRRQALREAHRLLKRGGLVFAAACSQYAALLDEVICKELSDQNMLARVLTASRTGQYRNPHGAEGEFTTAYFHEPAELQEEIQGAGFQAIQLFGLEGPFWLAAHAQELYTNRMPEVLAIMNELETVPSLLGMSGHILAVGRKY
jgi:SAM-dependent methyltransferase